MENIKYTVSCPHCSKIMNFKLEAAQLLNRQLNCLQCKTQFTITKELIAPYLPMSTPNPPTLTAYLAIDIGIKQVLVALKEGTYTIGREQLRNMLYTAETLQDVSSTHCTLVVKYMGTNIVCLLQNCVGKNGTWLNTRRIDAEEIFYVQHAQTIQIGYNTVCRFWVSEATTDSITTQLNKLPKPVLNY